MKGTWKTTGGGSDGAATAVLAVAMAAVLAAGAVRWLGAHAWWILGGAVTLLALAVAGTWFAWRAARRAKRADLAQLAASGQAWRDEMAAPQASEGTRAPAIVNHYHQDIHIHGSAPEQVAAAIRAIPGKVQP